ncbi:MAG: hypothetical protein IJM37_10480 [Lachnospiraceae bacterium]|nr:hypothetical protein [Lachnospiraceae bacterium]
MKFNIERVVETKGLDENHISRVVFPCNLEELVAEMQVNTADDLVFVDKDADRYSVKQFNYIMRDADARAQKIIEEINATVRFLQQRMEKNPNYKGTSDNLALSQDDLVVWNYCMKDDYKHPDEKVAVWAYRGSLTVFYGEKKG